MLSFEEKRILSYLKKYRTATVDHSLVRWNHWAVSNLVWFGYITIYTDAAGRPHTLEITGQGLGKLGETHVRMPAASS